MLKDIGLQFKRIPLNEKVANVKGVAYTPEIVKGSKKAWIHDVSDFPDFTFNKALGIDYEQFVKEEAKSSFALELKGSESLWLQYNNVHDLVMHNSIVVDAFQENTVILEHLSQGDVHLGQTKILVKEGARLNLIKLQNNGEMCQYVDETLIQVEDRASINIIDLQLGSEKMIVNYHANLQGYESQCFVNSLYIASENKGIDLSFTANHMGKKTQSNIMGKGVLSGQAKKVFRGTLNFERGSTKSVGKEEESVLLLSEHVKSDSIPALMCSEDDVIGEHGASIGQIDDNQLFYLMSRGLSETEAKLLVIASSFREVVEGIEDEEFREKTIESLDRSIKYAI